MKQTHQAKYCSSNALRFSVLVGICLSLFMCQIVSADVRGIAETDAANSVNALVTNAPVHALRNSSASGMNVVERTRTKRHQLFLAGLPLQQAGGIVFEPHRFLLNDISPGSHTEVCVSRSRGRAPPVFA